MDPRLPRGDWGNPAHPCRRSRHAAPQSSNAPISPEIGVREIVDDVVMVLVGRFPSQRRRAEPGPDIGEQRILAAEFRPLGAADPAGQSCAGDRFEQRRALRARLRGVEPEIDVHFRAQQWAQVMDAGDRHGAIDASAYVGHQRGRGRQHARGEMSAGGMAGKVDRPRHERRRHRYCGADIADDVANAYFGAKPIARHRYRETAPQRAQG